MRAPSGAIRIGGVAAALAAWTLVAACWGGPSANETDLRTLDTLLESGLAVDDPHARAETVRAVQAAESSRLADRIRPALDDDQPMVRASAVHTLLALDHPEARRLATATYNDAEASTRKSILRSAVQLDIEGLEEDLVPRAIRQNQPDDLRRVAFGESLAPRLRRAAESGKAERVKMLDLPKLYNTYTLELDTVLGGKILRMLVELGDEERVDPVVEILGDRSEKIERRLRAARILVDAGSERAIPAFSEIIQASKVDPDDQSLGVPEPRIDRRLVRTSVFGMVAAGDDEFVPRAKLYMEEADTDRFIRVLEALALNPAEGARLSIENAMADARPAVRRRAVELYAEREDAKAEPLLDLVGRDSFSQGGNVVRRRLARLLARRFPDTWVDRLKNQLNSQEGALPALEQLTDVWSIPAGREVVGRLEEELTGLLEEDDPAVVRRAAFLLIKIGDGSRNERLRGMTAPRVRYAYLERAVRNSPDEHVGFFLDNLYARDSAPELHGIRLMAGIGLWASSRDRSIASVVTPADAGDSGR